MPSQERRQRLHPSLHHSTRASLVLLQLLLIASLPQHPSLLRYHSPRSRIHLHTRIPLHRAALAPPTLHLQFSSPASVPASRVFVGLPRSFMQRHLHFSKQPNLITLTVFFKDCCFLSQARYYAQVAKLLPILALQCDRLSLPHLHLHFQSTEKNFSFFSGSDDTLCKPVCVPSR